MKYVIKLFSEITIKSKGVRQMFTKKLYYNIAEHIKQVTLDFDLEYFWDKIELDLYDERISIEVENTLKKVPGISNFLRVVEHNFLNLDDLFEKIYPIYAEKLRGKTFVVRIKRTGNHAFNSMEAERYLGGCFLKKIEGLKVSLENPDIIISVEIKDDKFYIIEEKFEGLGGYPVGIQNKALSMISGGFDSPVASFLMNKRGVSIDYLFFSLGGIAHEIGVKQVTHYIWKNFAPASKAYFITINFEDVIKEILLNVDHKYRGVILKRMMFKIANKITSKYGYEAIITGEAVGQVSSQTLTNLGVITKASETMILRPLISVDKEDIINISRKIGTYDYSASMPEYCGVVSDKPTTSAVLEEVLLEEAKINEIVLEKCFEERKVEKVRNLVDNINELDINGLEVTSELNENEIIIDLRVNANIIKSPLKQKNVLNIPFYEINTAFKNLDSKKTYLFFCDKGVLSKMHALYLKEKGFLNIKLYRP